MRAEPRDRRRDDSADVKPLRQSIAQRHPVEALVIVERRALTVYRPGEMRSRSGEHARAIFTPAVRACPRVVPETAPARNASGGLLHEQRQPCFHGHADQKDAVRGEQSATADRSPDRARRRAREPPCRRPHRSGHDAPANRDWRWIRTRTPRGRRAASGSRRIWSSSSSAPTASAGRPGVADSMARKVPSPHP